MTRLGSGRAGWLLGGLAVVLVGVVAAGTVAERGGPSATSADYWAQQTPVSPAVPDQPLVPTLTAVPPTSLPPTPVPTAPVRYVFPVQGKVSYQRTHHDYPATDIIAACGSPVLAVTDGVVLEVSRTDTYDRGADDGAKRGGLFIAVLGDDGVRYYGSHLRMLVPGVEAQVRVKAGDKLGEVGDTGYAGACHLHFGISALCARTGDWWLRRGTVWPWSYLDAWAKNTSLSPVPEVSAWTAKNGCPGAP